MVTTSKYNNKKKLEGAIEEKRHDNNKILLDFIEDNHRYSYDNSKLSCDDTYIYYNNKSNLKNNFSFKNYLNENYTSNNNTISNTKLDTDIDAIGIDFNNNIHINENLENPALFTINNKSTKTNIKATVGGELGHKNVTIHNNNTSDQIYNLSNKSIDKNILNNFYKNYNSNFLINLNNLEKRKKNFSNINLSSKQSSTKDKYNNKIIGPNISNNHKHNKSVDIIPEKLFSNRTSDKKYNNIQIQLMEGSSKNIFTFDNHPRSQRNLVSKSNKIQNQNKISQTLKMKINSNQSRNFETEIKKQERISSVNKFLIGNRNQSINNVLATRADLYLNSLANNYDSLNAINDIPYLEKNKMKANLNCMTNLNSKIVHICKDHQEKEAPVEIKKIINADLTLDQRSKMNLSKTQADDFLNFNKQEAIPERINSASFDRKSIKYNFFNHDYKEKEVFIQRNTHMSPEENSEKEKLLREQNFKIPFIQSDQKYLNKKTKQTNNSTRGIKKNSMNNIYSKPKDLILTVKCFENNNKLSYNNSTKSNIFTFENGNKIHQNYFFSYTNTDNKISNKDSNWKMLSSQCKDTTRNFSDHKVSQLPLSDIIKTSNITDMHQIENINNNLKNNCLCNYNGKSPINETKSNQISNTNENFYDKDKSNLINTNTFSLLKKQRHKNSLMNHNIFNIIKSEIVGINDLNINKSFSAPDKAFKEIKMENLEENIIKKMTNEINIKLKRNINEEIVSQIRNEIVEDLEISKYEKSRKNALKESLLQSHIDLNSIDVDENSLYHPRSVINKNISINSNNKSFCNSDKKVVYRDINRYNFPLKSKTLDLFDTLIPSASPRKREKPIFKDLSIDSQANHNLHSPLRTKKNISLREKANILNINLSNDLIRNINTTSFGNFPNIQYTNSPCFNFTSNAEVINGNNNLINNSTTNNIFIFTEASNDKKVEKNNIFEEFNLKELKFFDEKMFCLNIYNKETNKKNNKKTLQTAYKSEKYSLGDDEAEMPDVLKQNNQSKKNIKDNLNYLESPLKTHKDFNSHKVNPDINIISDKSKITNLNHSLENTVNLAQKQQFEKKETTDQVSEFPLKNSDFEPFGEKSQLVNTAHKEYSTFEINNSNPSKNIDLNTNRNSYFNKSEIEKKTQNLLCSNDNIIREIQNYDYNNTSNKDNYDSLKKTQDNVFRKINININNANPLASNKEKNLFINKRLKNTDGSISPIFNRFNNEKNSNTISSIFNDNNIMNNNEINKNFFNYNTLKNPHTPNNNNKFENELIEEYRRKFNNITDITNKSNFSVSTIITKNLNFNNNNNNTNLSQNKKPIEINNSIILMEEEKMDNTICYNDENIVDLNINTGNKTNNVQNNNNYLENTQIKEFCNILECKSDLNDLDEEVINPIKNGTKLTTNPLYLKKSKFNRSNESNYFFKKINHKNNDHPLNHNIENLTSSLENIKGDSLANEYKSIRFKSDEIKIVDKMRNKNTRQLLSPLNIRNSTNYGKLYEATQQVPEDCTAIENSNIKNNNKLQRKNHQYNVEFIKEINSSEIFHDNFENINTIMNKSECKPQSQQMNKNILIVNKKNFPSNRIYITKNYRKNSVQKSGKNEITNLISKPTELNANNIFNHPENKRDDFNGEIFKNLNKSSYEKSKESHTSNTFNNKYDHSKSRNVCKTPAHVSLKQISDHSLNNINNSKTIMNSSTSNNKNYKENSNTNLSLIDSSALNLINLTECKIKSDTNKNDIINKTYVKDASYFLGNLINKNNNNNQFHKPSKNYNLPEKIFHTKNNNQSNSNNYLKEDSQITEINADEIQSINNLNAFKKNKFLNKNLSSGFKDKNIECNDLDDSASLINFNINNLLLNRNTMNISIYESSRKVILKSVAEIEMNFLSFLKIHNFSSLNLIDVKPVFVNASTIEKARNNGNNSKINKREKLVNDDSCSNANYLNSNDNINSIFERGNNNTFNKNDNFSNKIKENNYFNSRFNKVTQEERNYNNKNLISFSNNEHYIFKKEENLSEKFTSFTKGNCKNINNNFNLNRNELITNSFDKIKPLDTLRKRKSMNNSIFVILTFLTGEELEALYFSFKRMRLLIIDVLLMEINRKLLKKFNYKCKNIIDLQKKQLVFKKNTSNEILFLCKLIKIFRRKFYH